MVVVEFIITVALAVTVAFGSEVLCKVLYYDKEEYTTLSSKINKVDEDLEKRRTAALLQVLPQIPNTAFEDSLASVFIP
jgi:hypothetical protein